MQRAKHTKQPQVEMGIKKSPAECSDKSKKKTIKGENVLFYA